MLAPLLSEADPIVSSEGSLDPLGMAVIAESLAVRLVPGVRERQAHPRFLTATAASLVVCSAFDEDTVADDEFSEPWQVFEWYLVEGLVRELDRQHTRGLPGRLKAEQAIRNGVPLSAARYLKTPRVFGFHGVYRGLAQDLVIESDGRLGELGYQLMQVWSSEQGLDGFIGTSEGAGQAWRRLLTDALSDGLKQAAVARKAGWRGWTFFAQHLNPYAFGEREAELIREALLADGSGFRGTVMRFLVSPAGRDAIGDSETISERDFHAALLRVADGELRAILEAIQTYELFARLLQDAFDDCLHEMTRQHGRTRLSELTSLPCVRRAAEQVPALYQELVKLLARFETTDRFRLIFEDIADRLTLGDWVERLLSHHQVAQRRKPPAGKAPWFERFDDGSYVIRPLYHRDEAGRQSDDYAHGYRTVPLSSFASDLGMIR